MATAFLDLIILLFWPFVLSSAGWAILANALRDRDAISGVVHALTQPDADSRLNIEVGATEGRSALRNKGGGANAPHSRA